MITDRWQSRPPTLDPFIRSAVQISLTLSASNRPNASGGRPSGRVLSSRAANHRWTARSVGTCAGPSRAIRIRRTCAAVRAGFSIFRPTARSTTSASARGGHCRGSGTRASTAAHFWTVLLTAAVVYTPLALVTVIWCKGRIQRRTGT
jgi:hypothetical protein